MASEEAQPKFDVCILGATGSVGQRFIQLLNGHPWFRIEGLGASERSAGKQYRQATKWKLDSPIPDDVKEKPVFECVPSNFPKSRIAFSGLDASVAGPIEEDFAKAGFAVFSNAKNHRYDDDVPILLPTVNPSHIHIIDHQKKKRGYSTGFIVTNSNCATTGVVAALKPLDDKFGVEQALVMTMQAVSGSGYPGLPVLDIHDNVVPYISGEEEKLAIEPSKMLGRLSDDKTSFVGKQLSISAHCNRVNVLDGHMACISIKTSKEATVEEAVDTLQKYATEIQALGLPSAPRLSLHVFDEEDRPQTRLDRNLERGYACSVGRVRSCALLGLKMVVLSHNTVLGAAGASILNAEHAVKTGYLG